MRMRAALAASALCAAACGSSVSGRGAASASESSTHAPPMSSSSTLHSAPTASGSPTHASATPRHRFLIDDVTFVGDDAWALGTATCAARRCATLRHSTDRGLTWSRMAPPPVHVAVLDGSGASCTDPCVAHIRFATGRIGYLYGTAPWSSDGSTALLMTTDGGRTWRRQPGGADALETLNGNVIRVIDRGGCPPGCTYSVQLAPIGGTSWRTVPLPGSQGPGDAVQLVRTGRLSALEVYGNPAGGAPAQAVLFTSGDNGATWTRRGEPCPQQRSSQANPHGEVDSSMLTSAADGSLTVLCTPRDQTSWQFTTTSRDGGATFRPGYRRALGSAGISALAAASAGTVLVSSDLTYRSSDGGRHFRKVAGPVAWLGFASGTVGHAVSLDRRSVWMTTDAGRTWQVAAVR